jgi:hypothetical protein
LGARHVSTGVVAMNFFEIYFGISPDGGDGSMEALFLLMLASMIVAILLHLRFRGKSRHLN